MYLKLDYPFTNPVSIRVTIESSKFNIILQHAKEINSGANINSMSLVMLSPHQQRLFQKSATIFEMKSGRKHLVLLPLQKCCLIDVSVCIVGTSFSNKGIKLTLLGFYELLRKYEWKRKACCI